MVERPVTGENWALRRGSRGARCDFGGSFPDGDGRFSFVERGRGRPRYRSDGQLGIQAEVAHCYEACRKICLVGAAAGRVENPEGDGVDLGLGVFSAGWNQNRSPCANHHMAGFHAGQ